MTTAFSIQRLATHAPRTRLCVLLLIPVVAGCSLAGCGRKQDSAESETAPTTTTSTTAASGPATSTTTTSAATAAGNSSQPASTPTTGSSPQPVDSALRELAARLLAADGQGGWRINESSATELEKLGPSGVVNLWPLLNDPKVEVRRGAAFYLLGQFSPGSADQVAAFTHLLDDNDRSIRNLALNAAKQFRQADQIAAVPRLTAMLDPQREDKPENRTAVVRLFGSLKASAAEALSSLSATAASDPDAKVRAAALAAISQVAAPGGAVSPLAKGLSDSQPQVRVVAAARLRQLGPAAAAAAAELAAALGDADQSVADAAAEALLRIGPAAVDPLAAQLSSSSLPARKMALACLAKIGPPAGSATQQIEKCKQDADPQVRQLAEAALRRITGK